MRLPKRHELQSQSESLKTNVWRRLDFEFHLIFSRPGVTYYALCTNQSIDVRGLFVFFIFIRNALSQNCSWSRGYEREQERSQLVCYALFAFCRSRSSM